jgi:hypothetical protein
LTLFTFNFKKEFHQQLPVASFFDNPTIAAIAKYVLAHRQDTPPSIEHIPTHVADSRRQKADIFSKITALSNRSTSH